MSQNGVNTIFANNFFDITISTKEIKINLQSNGHSSKNLINEFQKVIKQNETQSNNNLNKEIIQDHNSESEYEYVEEYEYEFVDEEEAAAYEKKGNEEEKEKENEKGKGKGKKNDNEEEE